jgi:peroxiredoxin
MPVLLDDTISKEMISHSGRSIYELSNDQSVLLIFLRHFGCIFCREAIHDLSKMQEDIKNKGVRLVFVHMAEPEVADEYFENYGLSGVEAVSDPQCRFYEAFGLLKGGFRQLYGLKVWIRGFEAGLSKGIGFSTQQIGDGFQMPGVFIVKKGKILDSFIHKSIADIPDYDRMLNCCS